MQVRADWCRRRAVNAIPLGKRFNSVHSPPILLRRLEILQTQTACRRFESYQPLAIYAVVVQWLEQRSARLLPPLSQNMFIINTLMKRIAKRLYQVLCALHGHGGITDMRYSKNGSITAICKRCKGTVGV